MPTYYDKICLYAKCNKEFKVLPKDKTRKFCLSDCARDFKRKIKEHLNCLNCNKLLNKDQKKFCSHTCSSISSNKIRADNGWTHTNETIANLRKIAKNNPSGVVLDKSKLWQLKVQKIEKICPTCEKAFMLLPCRSDKKFCSLKCVKSGGLRLGSGRAKTGWYNGIYCGSTYELAFLIWHLDNNIQIKRCDKIFEYEYEGKNRKYFPDFEIGDQIYEIKGRLQEIDLIKIKSANAILIDKDKMDFYVDYVAKKHNINKRQLFKLYE